MEIAATGLPGLGALTGSTAGGEDTAAFAAALAAFGSEVRTSSDTKGVAVPSMPGESPSIATPEATVLEVPPTGADLRLHLLASTAGVQTASAEAIEGEASVPQPILPGDGEQLAASLIAEEAQPSLLAPELTPPPDEAQMAAEPVQEDGAAATSSGAPVPSGAASPSSPQSVLPKVDGAPIEIAAETAEAAAPQVEQGQDSPDDLAADAPPIVPLRGDQMARAQIAAPVQPVQRQASKADTSKAQELTLSAGRTTQSAGSPAEENSASPSEVFESTEDSFAGAVQKAAPERTSQQSNAAPAPLLTGQTPDQRVAASAPPAALVPSGSVETGAAAPMPTSSAPEAPAPTTGTHPVMAFRSDKMAREMGLEIAKRVSAGGEELVIRLDPAELGRINIRMSVNEHGQLRAVVTADAPSVIDAIRSDLAELNRAMEQAGVRTDSQSFRFDRGGNGDPGHQWQQRYQQNSPGTRPGDGSGLAMADDDLSYRPLATNGRINMMA